MNWRFGTPISREDEDSRDSAEHDEEPCPGGQERIRTTGDAKGPQCDTQSRWNPEE